MEPFEILYLDEDIAVVNKISSLPVLKDKSGDTDLQTLLAARLNSASSESLQGDAPPQSAERKKPKAQKRFLEAAHRIDRRTSGIVVFARNIASLRTLERMFQERKIRKTYLACVENEPSPVSGRLEHNLLQNKRDNRAIAMPISSQPKGWTSGQKRNKPESAVLDYSLMAQSDRYYFLSVEPSTGRHHQIRAQLSAMGWPIKGDIKYGARRSNPSGRILLHAWKIEFSHPRSNVLISLTAPPPRDEPLWEFFLSLPSQGA